MGVVVLHVLGQDDLELAAVEDEHPVEAFPADGADKSFGEGIGPWCSNRCPDDLDSLGVEDVVEAGRELGVPVPYQESDWASPLAKHRRQISGLLDHPRSN